MTRTATVLFALSLSTSALAQQQMGSLYSTVIDVDDGVVYVIDTSCSMGWDNQHAPVGSAIAETTRSVQAPAQGHRIQPGRVRRRRQLVFQRGSRVSRRVQHA